MCPGKYRLGGLGWPISAGSGSSSIFTVWLYGRQVNLRPRIDTPTGLCFAKAGTVVQHLHLPAGPVSAAIVRLLLSLLQQASPASPESPCEADCLCAVLRVSRSGLLQTEPFSAQLSVAKYRVPLPLCCSSCRRPEPELDSLRRRLQPKECAISTIRSVRRALRHSTQSPHEIFSYKSRRWRALNGYTVTETVR